MLKIIVLSLSIVLVGCSSNANSGHPKKVKNVILMIGDGMGPQQISLLYYFAKYSKLGVVMPNEFSFERIAEKGDFGTSATEPYGNIVTDSACAATALAIADFSRPEMIGLDKSGRATKTILEKAIQKGIKTGLVSDTRITHATPASFASHVANRWSEDAIAEHMMEIGPDLLYSGGAERFIPKGKRINISAAFEINSRRADDQDLLAKAVKKGYQVIHSKNELGKIQSEKVLGLFTSHNMPDGIWYSQNKTKKDREIPTLLEMSKSAIHHLDKSENGFFLMIEGGQIDWTGHQNDAGGMLHEMISFNETLNWVIDWVAKNPDTLLVVTADHETGSFGFSYNAVNLPKPMPLDSKIFGKAGYLPNYNYGPLNIVDRLYGQKMTFVNLLNEYKRLPTKDQTAKRLKIMVEEVTGYNFSLEAARRVITLEKNPHYNPNHKYLKNMELPLVKDFSEFYPDPANNQTGLIARGLAGDQNIVWGTSGHTATPVHVYSMGPKNFTSKLSGYLHHSKVGKVLQEALDL